MSEALVGFQCATMWLCVIALISLAVIGAYALFAKAGKAAKRNVPPGARVIMIVGAIVAVIYGGSKRSTVTVDDPYIRDAGSYVTNDYVHIAIEKRTSVLPDETEILVYYRELASSNAEDWVELTPRLTFADFPYDYAIANATNYNYLVGASYTPEPTVHTNGVWVIKGFMIPGQSRCSFVNTKTRIYDARPYKYEVEYLESTGSQYINTGVKHIGANTLRFKFRMPTAGGNYNSAFADYVNESTAITRIIRVGSSTTDVYLYHRHTAGNAAATIRGLTANEPIEGWTTTTQYNINGITGNMNYVGNAGESSMVMRLFYNNGNGSASAAGSRIYYFTIDNQIDLIPVVDKSNVPCMYDRISGAFFYNAGTGSFTVGPRISE